MPKRYRAITDLPAEIPVFPLGGALLFPGASLPLNIFEPRYLAMVDDALAGSRLIGMIQLAGLAQTGAGDDARPLAEVGCAGRITHVQETDDGRYLIALSGVARFQVSAELSARRPYRSVRADWTRYAHDLQAPAPLGDAARSALLTALRAYLDRGGLSAEWSAIEEAPLETLIDSLSAGCPFTNPEKQALLEAATLAQRCTLLITLLDMERPVQGGGYVQ